MVEMSVKEIKKYQLELLRYLKSICDQNNLQYSLAYGTLLGAVRHKGYIPWDDDIDIFMDYPDYKRLIKYVDQDRKYILLTPCNNKNYYFSYAKLIYPHTLVTINDGYKSCGEIGVYVDIFPLIGLPENLELRERHLRKINAYGKFKFASVEEGLFPYLSHIGFIKSILRIPYVILCKMVGVQRWNAIIDNAMSKYDIESGYCGNPFGAEGVLRRYVYREKCTLLFEGEDYKCIKNYDLFLSAEYGDYMKYPPIEKRKSLHENEKVYKEDDFPVL